jgi:NADP-dependent 3-hydroxy acid dehydrogenase YdfG
VPIDVRDQEKMHALVKETAATHGRLDYIFNNAGIAIFGETQELSGDDWTRLIDVNIRGVVHGVQAAYPIMIKQGFGHIVNTASLAGLAPSPGFTGRTREP